MARPASGPCEPRQLSLFSGEPPSVARAVPTQPAAAHPEASHPGSSVMFAHPRATHDVLLVPQVLDDVDGHLEADAAVAVAVAREREVLGAHADHPVPHRTPR